MSFPSVPLTLASLGREPNCSDFQYFSLTASPLKRISVITWYLLIIQRFALFALWIHDALVSHIIPFSVLCFLWFFFDRLIEIAGNRFSTYFDSDEKLFCMTRSVHLYRELTCGSVLKRYSFPELKKKKSHILNGLSITIFVLYQTFMKSNSFIWGIFMLITAWSPTK